MAGSKVLKPVAGVVILVGLYAAAGYIGVPAGVRWAVSNVVPDALGGRDATVGDVSFNPWNWRSSQPTHRRTIFLPLSICRPI